MVSDTITLEGHLIDSDIMRRVFDRVVEEGGEFEVLEFRVGKRNDDPSFVSMVVSADSPDVLDRILEGLSYLGAATVVGDARFEPAGVCESPGRKPHAGRWLPQLRPHRCGSIRA